MVARNLLWLPAVAVDDRCSDGSKITLILCFDVDNMDDGSIVIKRKSGRKVVIARIILTL